MQRKTRTLWWLVQGSIFYWIVALSGYLWVGVLLFVLHLFGAIYSDIFQGEAQ